MRKTPVTLGTVSIVLGTLGSLLSIIGLATRDKVSAMAAAQSQGNAALAEMQRRVTEAGSPYQDILAYFWLALALSLVVVGVVVVLVELDVVDALVVVGSSVVGVVVEPSLAELVDVCPNPLVSCLPSSPQAPVMVAANDTATKRASDDVRRIGQSSRIRRASPSPALLRGAARECRGGDGSLARARVCPRCHARGQLR